MDSTRGTALQGIYGVTKHYAFFFFLITKYYALNLKKRHVMCRMMGLTCPLCVCFFLVLKRKENQSDPFLFPALNE